ncbi:MAG: hypothetical protein LBG22_07405 [Treponema sp.]|nr:hypothetical protein [Treponema sp.]
MENYFTAAIRRLCHASLRAARLTENYFTAAIRRLCHVSLTIIKPP